jgi:hypothetical protein
MTTLNIAAILICTLGTWTFTRTAQASAADDAPVLLVRFRYVTAALMAGGAVLSAAALVIRFA